jgi:hypothetical protein
MKDDGSPVNLDDLADRVAGLVFRRMDKFIATLEKLVRENALLQARAASLEEMLEDLSNAARDHGVNVRVTRYEIEQGDVDDDLLVDDSDDDGDAPN